MSETFGVWELRERLGQNELGDTHLAVRSSDGARAVIKRIRVDTNDERLVAALKQELALAAQLNHPAAARILEQGEVRGIPYVAIEHVLGISLARGARASRELHAWPLPMSRAAQVMAPILDALAAAHALTPPLLHRELVPENVRIDGTGRVVLTDFGLGRARLRAGGSAGMRGAFISPEQARGNTIDARSEVFAAGLMLFELVCGRLPAEGNAGEVISRIATGELDAARTVNPALDPAFVAVLDRALALKPEDRFATAADFRAALTPWLGDDPLGPWAQKLAMVQLPASSPALVPVPTAPPPPRPAAEVAAEPEPVAAVPPKPANRRNRRLAIAAVAAGALLTSQVVDLRSVFGTAAVENAGRAIELTTIPAGAQVWVDGVLEDRRTPLTLHFPKDEFKSLTFRKPGLIAWSGIVYNTKKLEVTLATGELEEEKYEGASRKKPPVLKTVATPLPPDEERDDPPPAPKPEVVFDVEAPPIDITLTAAHSVRADLGPSVEVQAGDELVLSEGGSLYFPIVNSSLSRTVTNRNTNPEYGGKIPNSSFAQWNPKTMPTYRLLDVFALHVEGKQVQVHDLARPLMAALPGTYYLFTPTESGELPEAAASVRFGGTTVPLGQRNVLRVDAIDSFLVRVMQPKMKYRLEVKRKDGEAGPLPPVVMTMRPDNDPTSSPGPGFESSIRFDNAPLGSGQTLVAAGVHQVTGARSAWFTIIAAGETPPVDVVLSLTPWPAPAPSKKRK